MADDTQNTGTVNTDAGGQQSNDDASKTPQTGATDEAQKTEGEATGEGKPPADGEQEVEYKFDAPDGIELDAAQVDQFKAIAKELKLPADKAKAIVDIAVKAEAARHEAFANQVKAWGDTVAADKELGDPENQAVARKAIDTFGTPELKSLLNSTGLGNHPEVVRLALRVGKAISEDAVHGKAAGEAPARDAASLLYPTNAKA